ncbi:hypothetical protein, partial [Methylobacterium sp. E-046]|uniref:hypothetical protein n=1 Tax=Methylobacterium sp. E-046 TaxID=2836576 RepID=UPI001FB8A2C0
QSSLTIRPHPVSIIAQVPLVNQVRLITAADFSSDCPVPLELVAQLTRAEPDARLSLLDGLTEMTRARLAVWLYGRSHTHEIGVRVAATCEEATLRNIAGLVGSQLYELSRQPYAAASHGMNGGGGRRQVSLGGSRASAHAFA